MSAIRAALAADGRGIVIVGAAGIGKTRVVRNALADAREGGAEVLWVRATNSAATVPLAAVVGLLPAGAGGDDPLRIFQASAEMLRRRSGERRLVLAIDDAHLLDPGSAALILHLVGTGASVVATARADAPAPDAITALWKDEGVVRLELEALPEPDTEELLKLLLGGPAEAVAKQWASRASGGNPLYLGELVNDAIATGALEFDGGLWRLRRRPPPGATLTALVAQRLENLDPGATLLLAALGIGEPLPAEIASDLSGAAALTDLLQRALAIADESDGGRFIRLAHPLYGEVTCSQMTADRLNHLRVRLAAALRERGLRPGDELRVATWLRDAGAPIDTQLLLEAAAAAYNARDPALAAELAARAGGEPAAVLALGQALAATGRHREAEDALARLEADPPPPRQAGTYLFTRLNVLLWGVHDGESARLLVERAAGWWPDESWRGQVDALRLMVLSATGSVQSAAAIADRLAADSGEDPQIAPLLATSGAVAWLHAGRTERALEATERALPTDERIGDREVAALVSWSLARLESGREWATVEESVARIERAAVRRGDRIAAGPAVGLLGYLALSRGAAVTAIRLLSDAAGHLELHDPRGLSVLIEAHIAQAAAMLGERRQAEAALARSRAHLGGREAAWHERSRLAIASAWLLAVRGEPTRGVDQLLEASSDMEEWPILQALMLQEALSLGAPATQVVAPLTAAAAGCDAPRVAVAATHAEALAGEDPERLASVAALFEEIGAWLLAAETAAQAAVLFDAGGRTAPARRAGAHSEGLLARCEGSSTPALRAASTLTAAITPREREIAELAATGRGNAEIAALLVISVRTVESHLYHAMSKLGVSERGELAAVLEVSDRLRGSPTSDIRDSTI